MKTPNLVESRIYITTSCICGYIMLVYRFVGQDARGGNNMTSETREFIQMLGLDVQSQDPAEERDKQTARRYIMSGSSIPQTLLFRLENYQRRIQHTAS